MYKILEREGSLAGKRQTENWDITMKRMGARIRQLRDRAGLSQREVQEKAGLARTTLQTYERGSYKDGKGQIRPSNPEFIELVMVAHAIGVLFTDVLPEELGGSPPLRSGTS
jgi:transcriptional regulator with XRE-family HTH domain